MATIATPHRKTPPIPEQAGVTRYPSMALAVAPSDVDIFQGPVSVRAGGAGVVNAVPEALRDSVLAGTDPATLAVAVTVPAGGDVPFEVCMVLDTGTDATLLIAVY